MHNSLALSTPGPRKANLSLTQAAVTLLQGTQLHTNGCMCAGKTGLCLCPRAESYQGRWDSPGLSSPLTWKAGVNVATWGLGASGDT